MEQNGSSVFMAIRFPYAGVNTRNFGALDVAKCSACNASTNTSAATMLFCSLVEQ